MGWASGSWLLDEMWNELREHIPEEKRAELLALIVKHFWAEDCDTFDEMREWPESEAALRKAGWIRDD